MIQSTVESAEPEPRNIRNQYSGAFVRVESDYSTFTGAFEQSIVFDDIQGPNLALLDEQQTFTYGKRFRALRLLEQGDRVQFRARVVYDNWLGGFKLSRPTKLKKIGYDTIPVVVLED